MDIGTAKPTAAERAEVPHHLIDVADPWEDYTLARFAAEARRAVAGDRGTGPPRPAGGRHGPVPAGRGGRPGVPGRFPEVRAEIEAEPDTPALHRRLAELDPVAAAAHGADQPPAGGAGAGGDAGQRPPVLVLRPGPRRLPADPLPPGRRGPAPRGGGPAGIEARYRQQMAAGFLAEARRACWPDPRGLSRTAGQALGYRELIDHLRRACSTWTRRWTLAMRRTRRFARRQRSWFRRDPRIRWLQALDDPLDPAPGPGAELAAAGGATGPGDLIGTGSCGRRADWAATCV